MKPLWWQQQSLEVLEPKISRDGELIPLVFGFERCSSRKKKIVYDKARYTLHFVLDGSGFLENQEVKAGSIFLLRPHCRLSYFPSFLHPWAYLWVEFVGSKALALFERMGWRENEVIHQGMSMEGIISIFDLAFSDQTRFHSAEALSLSLEGRLRSLLSLLWDEKETQSHPFLSAAKRTAYEAKDELISHCSDSDLSIEEMAKKYGYNPAYFSRLFRHEIGISPAGFLTKVRLEKAMTLLRDDTLTIRQISSACGYRNPFAFSREFKKANGVSPLEFRNQNQFNKTN